MCCSDNSVAGAAKAVSPKPLTGIAVDNPRDVTTGMSSAMPQVRPPMGRSWSDLP